MSVLQGSDAGMAAIGARFGISAGIGAAVGEGAADTALVAAGMRRAACRRPIMPVMLPPGMLTAVTTVGATLDLPHQFGPRTGWFWDIIALSVVGVTGGAIAVAKNAPALTAASNLSAIEWLWTFNGAGQQNFPRKGVPLLDASERLVFTVITAATSGVAMISGSVVMVPAERIDEYMR